MAVPHLNRLSKASSPYLQQHAKNPVDWYEWGEEAIEKAKAEDKPLLISIGYSTCHWCHVMAKESFMDEEVAKYMNAHFVAVKVDREERPDLDQIYIDAAQLLNGYAGWPLNVFALPDGRPFWVGVYFPKDNWLNVLHQLHKAYAEEREKVKKQATALTEGIDQELLVDLKATPDAAFSEKDYKELIEFWLEKIDFEKGGFKSTQKFPMVSGWEFLLQYSYLIKNKRVLEAVNTTLKEMAYGGIYDQLGGGFSRYATDEEWFAPHFEKMLYDNAQLVSLYARAYQYIKDPLYKTIVEETLAFIDRELTAEDGGFYAALNADSEGEEGKFMVWKASEIDNVLNEEGSALFKAFYNVTAIGNWEEGQNILYRNRSIEEFAQQRNRPVKEVEYLLASAKEKMMTARNQRIRPSTDDKILTSWNALMIKAYADAYFSLGRQAYLGKALRQAEFIVDNMQKKDGSIYRNYKNGTATIPGFLDDYVFLADAFIKLYQGTLETIWLKKAQKLMDYALAHFYEDKSGLFYYASDRSENLVGRKRELTDNEMPSSNAVAASVLFVLGSYLQDDNYLTVSEGMLKRMKETILKGAPYFGKWTSVLGMMSHNPYEIVVMGDKALTTILELQKAYLPTSLIMGGKTEDLPLMQDKLVKRKTMIYVCQNKSCRKPVQTVAEAFQQIN